MRSVGESGIGEPLTERDRPVPFEGAKKTHGAPQLTDYSEQRRVDPVGWRRFDVRVRRVGVAARRPGIFLKMAPALGFGRAARRRTN